MNWIESLFSSSGFMPHGYCYTWDPYVIWLNGLSDALIALAYYTIPVTLVYFVRRRKDLAFHWMYLGFALFIVACGTTHAIELWSIWHPVYWLAGTVKAVTAAASIATAIALIRLVPNALALPSPDDLRKANAALLEAQQALRKTNEELECRVAERTASLAAANAALGESEQLFRQLAENISEVFWVRDMAKDQLLYVSPAYERVWGRSCVTLYERPNSWLEAVHPEDEERVKNATPAAYDYDQEFRVVRPDGSVRWVHDRAFRVRDANGSPDRLVGVVQDITDRKEAEADKLYQREMRFRLMIEHASDLITLLNLEGIVRFQSPSLERVLGYPPAERIGRSAFELVHPDDLPKARQAFDRIRSEPSETVSMEVRCRHRNGQWKVLQARGRTLPPEGGEALVVLNSRDVTEQKDLEARLNHSQKMEAVGQLASGVAHDFNNLLSVIVGYSELLQMGLQEGGEALEAVKEIRRAAKRATSLTRQLLTFSRQQVIEPKVLELNTVVSDAEKMLSRIIGEDVELTTSLQAGLSPVVADPGQIEQVLMNLAVNARDAMPLGGKLRIETRDVRVSLAQAKMYPNRHSGRYVLMTVSDTGCGMPPEIQARIFEPFFTTKAVGHGTGLGLAVTDSIIEQSRGFCEVDSIVGKGTTFRIYLPVAKGSAGPEETDRSERWKGRGETILLVEDEETVNAVAFRMLESLGYRVFVADGPEEAIRLMKTAEGKKVDLLLTDVIMPAMSGRQLAEKIQSQRPGIKVLFQSGYADDVVIRHGILKAEVALLRKPSSLNVLAKRVREVLDQPRS
jgi:two-component system, cell cycle sensor histidine kinase and response regulator CckA